MPMFFSVCSFLMAMVVVQLWPEEKFPLQEFGKMVLDENIQNYFSDVESIAFDPGVTVPGKQSCLMQWILPVQPPRARRAWLLYPRPVCLCLATCHALSQSLPPCLSHGFECVACRNCREQ